MNEANILSRMVDAKHPLKDMALLVRRAGLEHLVVDPSPAEVEALANAGDELELRRAALLVKSFRDPINALRPFDGGAAARAETKRLAYTVSGRIRTGEDK